MYLSYILWHQDFVLYFLYKNKLYKNNEAESGKKIRTNEEHCEVENQKIEITMIYWRLTNKRMTWTPSKSSFVM